MKAQESFLPWAELQLLLDEMNQACLNHDCEAVRELLLSAPTGFQPTTDIEDLVSIQSGSRKRHMTNVIEVAEHARAVTSEIRN